jgi:hypothetical protein
MHHEITYIPRFFHILLGSSPYTIYLSYESIITPNLLNLESIHIFCNAMKQVPKKIKAILIVQICMEAIKTPQFGQVILKDCK